MLNTFTVHAGYAHRKVSDQVSENRKIIFVAKALLVVCCAT
jgi:hypothetical protein